MTDLLTIPGFAINPDQRDNAELPDQWLALFGLTAIPQDQRLESVIMFSLQRPEDLERVEIYYDRAVELGFHFHVRVHQGAGVGMAAIKARYPFATVAFGNGKRAGDALLKRGDVLEDDAGIRSAVQVARAKPNLPIAFHEYGEAGFDPVRHLRLLRHWYPTQRFWMTEAAWSFEPYDGTATSTTGPSQETTAAGVYCRLLVNAAAIHEIPVTLFRGIDFFRKERGEYRPTPAALSLAGADGYGWAYRPPARKARDLTVGMYRRQYLPV